MTEPRIYTSQALCEGARIVLEESPSRHLAGALRRGPGDSLQLFDGQGCEHRAEIATVARKTVEVTVGPAIENDVESPLATHLGIAVSRGERMDWVIQKSTELGVTTITPLLTERTGVKLSNERAQKRLSHWRHVAISACEQCGRNRLPVIQPLEHLAHWLSATQADKRLVLDPAATGTAEDSTTPATVALLVGPEGGFSAPELQAARHSGWQGLGLGPRVLRTETAPVVALTIIQARWGDLETQS